MRGKFLSLALLLGLASTSAFAAPIAGNLFITGDLRVGADFINFAPLDEPTGGFNIESVSDGSFDALEIPATEDDGLISDLSAATAPIGSTFSLPNFLTFNADPTITFELTFISPSSFGACPGPNPCGVNQFTLLQLPNSVSAGFEVYGKVYDDGVYVSNFQGSFSQTLVGRTVNGLLTQIAQQGYFDSAFDANFIVTPIPEPGTISMLAVGGVLVGLSRFLKRR